MDDYFAGYGSQRPAPPEPFGVPPYPPPAAPGWHHQPAAPGWNPQWAVTDGAGSGLARVLLWLAVAVGAIVVLGVLAAVAIPVFLDQRATGEAGRTSVSAPATVAGWSRLTDPASLALEKQLVSVSTPGVHVAGVYGTDGRPHAFFGASHAAMSFRDRRDFLAGAEAGAQRSPETAGAVFSDSDPGRLGGTMRCATLVRTEATVCFFADAGAYGMVTVFAVGEQGQGHVRTLREAVERRS